MQTCGSDHRSVATPASWRISRLGDGMDIDPKEHLAYKECVGIEGTFSANLMVLPDDMANCSTGKSNAVIDLIFLL